MRIVPVVATYKRPILEDTLRLLSKQKYVRDIVVVGSCSDDREHVRRSGVSASYFSYPNRPLSDKWQFAVSQTRELDPDGVLICGSDDMVIGSWTECACDYLSRDYDLIGMRNWIIAYREGNEVVLASLSYQRRKDPIGAGRVISRRLLEKCDWEIYPGGKDAVLDKASYKMMKKAGCRMMVVPDMENIISVKGNWRQITETEAYLRSKRVKKDMVSGEKKEAILKENGEIIRKYLMNT